MKTRKVTAHVSSFVAGLGAMAAIWPTTTPMRYPHASTTEALRGDAVRIGSDMRRVIAREKLKAAKK
ncbi:MAG TPA: hypothetical protein VGO22_19135 [Pseudorhizobium sp.]|nr:hypothetical protein [Pseudorhizobium sp.]